MRRGHEARMAAEAAAERALADPVPKSASSGSQPRELCKGEDEFFAFLQNELNF